MTALFGENILFGPCTLEEIQQLRMKVRFRDEELDSFELLCKIGCFVNIVFPTLNPELSKDM
jgi:hypothetical protein